MQAWKIIQATLNKCGPIIIMMLLYHRSIPLSMLAPTCAGYKFNACLRFICLEAIPRSSHVGPHTLWLSTSAIGVSVSLIGAGLLSVPTFASKLGVSSRLNVLIFLFIFLRSMPTLPDAETPNAPPPTFKDPPIEFYGSMHIQSK